MVRVAHPTVSRACAFLVVLGRVRSAHHLPRTAQHQISSQTLNIAPKQRNAGGIGFQPVPTRNRSAAHLPVQARSLYHHGRPSAAGTTGPVGVLSRGLIDLRTNFFTEAIPRLSPSHARHSTALFRREGIPRAPPFFPRLRFLVDGWFKGMVAKRLLEPTRTQGEMHGATAGDDYCPTISTPPVRDVLGRLRR